MLYKKKKQFCIQIHFTIEGKRYTRKVTDKHYLVLGGKTRTTRKMSHTYIGKEN